VNESATPADAGYHRKLFVVVSCMLIASLVYRVLIPADELPSRAEQILTIGFDLGMVIGLFGMRDHGPKALFWPAMIAGVCLLLIRFTSAEAAWTGHLIYALSPR
jgi:hypothetical protein